MVPVMSFAKQITICRHDDASTEMPTEQELQLSRLVRPGMTGGCQIKQILLPGKYAYDPAKDALYRSVNSTVLDVTESRRDSVRPPNLVRIEMASWQWYRKMTWTAYLASTIHEVSVPVHAADDATLGYYNCRILKPGDVISLNHRSIVTDFLYRDDYFDSYVVDIIGGSLIEQHAFAHVDTPIHPHSGYLVIGKIDSVDQALELTAFVVKAGDSVYIPAGTIHTNDYLLGTWQTLLSSDCEFPNARLRRPGDKPLRFVIGHNQ